MQSSIAPTSKTIVVIAGPTASGKTALSLQLAEKLGSDIFSADSRQLYKEMTIGTAKPTQAELDRVRHHFINHISIRDAYSAGQYADECREALATYFETRDTAVVTGGTGFYLRLLLEGMDDMPEISDEIKIKYEHLLAVSGVTALADVLQQRDPVYASVVDLQNPRRLHRALCVIEATGRPYSEYRRGTVHSLPYKVIPFLLDMPREILYERINRRVDIMLDNGLKEEVLSLIEHKDLPSLQTVGYQEWYDMLSGNLHETAVANAIKQNTRRYAKRQMTWFRRHGEWHIITPEAYDRIIDIVAQHNG